MSDIGFRTKSILTDSCSIYSFIKSLCVFVCCFVILTCVGVFLYKQKSNYTGKTNATINSSHCNPKLVYENNRNNTYYDCDLNLTYKVSDKDYSGNLHTLTQTNYETTNNVDIDYEPSNPHSIQLHQIFKNKTISIILLVIACLCLISTIVHTGMYFNNDWYRKKLCVDLLNETVQSQYPSVVVNL